MQRETSTSSRFLGQLWGSKMSRVSNPPHLIKAMADHQSQLTTPLWEFQRSILMSKISWMPRPGTHRVKVDAHPDSETWGRDWVNSWEPRSPMKSKTRTHRRSIQRWSKGSNTWNLTITWWSWLQIKSSREARSSILVRLWSLAPNQSRG